MVAMWLLWLQAIQNIGNLGLQIGCGKEVWMEPLHPFIKNSVTAVKNYIDEIVMVDESQGQSGSNL